MEQSTEQNLQPTALKKRVVEMDIIRGFALLGVLLVNLTMMGGINTSNMTKADQVIAALVSIFAEGKFYTIFSFLFGLGFYFFMSKVLHEEATEEERLLHQKRFKRRLWSLFLFGALHFLLVWNGDILHLYALTGFLLLRKSRKHQGSLKKKIIFLFCFSTLIISIGYGAVLNPDFKETLMETSSIEDKITVFSEGSFFDAFYYRLTSEAPEALIGLIAAMPKILALFYIGYSVGKAKVFQNLHEHQESIKKLLKKSGVFYFLSILGFVTLILVQQFVDYHFVLGFFVGVFKELATLAGSCFYITLLLSIMKNGHIPKLLSPLQYVGRMALTNYLTQTIFWLFVINGYGLGMYGKIPMAIVPLLALSFFTLQIFISRFWLSKHRFGPMEKLWRKMTYGKIS